MATLHYYIRELLFGSSDINKIKYCPSSISYYYPFFLLQFSFTLFIALYFLTPSSSQDPLYEMIRSLIWVTVITSSLNLFTRIRWRILCDLRDCLYYDFVNDSAKYGEDYMYYEEMMANHRYFKTNNQTCPLCLNDFANDPMVYDKSLLHCGHLYHKGCLQQHEDFQWHNDIEIYSLGECVQCHQQYHAFSQNFDFNENYLQTLPPYLRPFPYFGEQTLNSLCWDPIYREYEEYRNQEPRHRPNRYFSIIKCIESIILNIFNFNSEQNVNEGLVNPLILSARIS